MGVKDDGMWRRNATEWSLVVAAAAAAAMLRNDNVSAPIIIF